MQAAAAATPLAVEIDGLAVVRGGRVLLELPRLAVRAGERVAIVGANGAGKSTLLRVLGGFVPATTGRVRVLGRELGRELGPALPARALRELRAEVGQMMQGLHPVPRLTARENVLIGALARWPGWRSWARLPSPALRAEAEAALAELGLAALADQRADRLSGGERQKLALARLRLQRPRLVLADEPTSALDPTAVEEACAVLAGVAQGATLLTVLHHPALLPRLAGRVIGLREGRLVWDLPVERVDAESLAQVYRAVARPGPGLGAPADEVHLAPALVDGRARGVA
ncbi:MAG: ATP-binding cassette domain-containing protein [Burkholderiales bacterium]|nr:ATP-binding cassette domain-containing protein [Burkholderiales bacterium]